MLEVKAKFVDSPFLGQEVLVTDVRRLEQFTAPGLVQYQRLMLISTGWK